MRHTLDNTNKVQGTRTHITLAFHQYRDRRDARYETDETTSDSSFSPEQPTYIGAMISPRAQSPIRTQSPSHLTTDELLTTILSQKETLTNAFNSLKKENDNRIKEISQLARKIGCSAEVEIDKEAPQLEMTEDTSDGEQEDGRVNPKENINRSKFCTQPTYEGEDHINATIALETIRTLNE